MKGTVPEVPGNAVEQPFLLRVSQADAPHPPSRVEEGYGVLETSARTAPRIVDERELQRLEFCVLLVLKKAPL
jgi:hypothetical protein